MSYNKKALLSIVKKLDKAKAPGKPKDIIKDPMGQWKYPGQNTRIPGNNITMQGVNYPVWAQPNVGPGAMMEPGQDYSFPGADYVDEFPQNEDFYEDDLDEEQIAELRAGGYIVEDISVPQLTQAQEGGIQECNEDGRCEETDQIQNILDEGSYIPKKNVNVMWDVVDEIEKQSENRYYGNAEPIWKSKGAQSLSQRLGNTPAITNVGNCMWAAGMGYQCLPETKGKISLMPFESNDKFINAVNKGAVPFSRVTKTHDPNFASKETGLLQQGDIVNFKGGSNSHAMTFSNYNDNGDPIFLDSNGRANDFGWNKGMWNSLIPNKEKVAYVSRFNPEKFYEKDIKSLEEKARTNPTMIEKKYGGALAQNGGQKEGEVLDIPEMQAYADPNKRKQQNKLIDKARAIASTIEGRQALKEGNYKNFSIESMKRFIKSATDYKKEAEDYHKARRLVSEDKMDSDSFARRYNEKGWAKFDEATANENYKGEYQQAVDKANKRKEKNMAYTDAVLELTGAPALLRIAADPIGTAKGVGQTIGDLATLPYGVAEGAYNYATDGNFDMGTNAFGQKYGEGLNETLDVLAVAPAFAGVSKITDLATPALIKGVNKLGKTLGTESGVLSNAYKLNRKALKEVQEVMLVRARPVGQDPYINMAESLRAKEAAGEPLKWYQKNLLNPQTNPDILAREKYYGQWFADNPSDLDFYINPATRNFADDAQIEILKVRMPKSEAAKYNVKNFEDAKTLSNLHDTEYILPKDMVQQAEKYSVNDLQKLMEEYNQINKPHWLKGYPEVPLELPSSPNAVIPENSNIITEQRTIANKAMESTDLGGNNPIQIGNESNPNPFYNIDPDDYDNMQQALTMGKEDAQQSLKRYFDNNVLSYKDPKFTSEYNAAKFKMETGLDQPGGPQIGTDITKWKGVDKEDLFVPSIEDIKKYNLDQEGMVYPSHVRNETLISREQELDALKNVQEKALKSGDMDLANEYEKYIAKLKSDALKEYSKPYTADEALRTTTSNASNTTTGEIKGIDLSKEMRDEYNVISKAIEDARAKKVDNWQTPEGRKRLQDMIDNTPALKSANVTPESYVEGIVNMSSENKNYLEKLYALDKTNDEIMRVDALYAENKISENDWVTSLMKLEDEVLKQKNDILDARTSVNNFGSAGASMSSTRPVDLVKSMYDKNGKPITDWKNFKAVSSELPPDKFKIRIGEKTSPQNLKQTVEHEIAHLIQKSEITSLDKELSEITLKGDDLFTNLPFDIDVKQSGWSEFKNSPDYLGRSKNYYLTGSGGLEKLPFASEVRSDLLEKGIIKHDYDKITPEMLEKHYNTYMKQGRNEKEIPLRLYDIMENQKSNFNKLSSVLNKLAVTTGVTTGLSQLKDNEPKLKKGGAFKSYGTDKLKKFIN